MPSYLTTWKSALTAVVATSALVGTALLAGPASATTTHAVDSPARSATAGATANRVDAARYGAGYLARTITANGGYLAPFGAPDNANTAYGVLALHAARVGAKAERAAIAYLETQANTPDAFPAQDGSDDPGALGYVILAAVAHGENPRAFGGTSAANNLVARLRATARPSGTDKGLFGSADPTFDGAFRQGIALTALKAAGVPASKLTANLRWLTGQQCANGLWTSYRTDTTVACAAADPTTFSGPDTNSSALAAEGLAAYGLHPHKALLLKGLRAAQASDGGFPYIAAAGQTSDPNSTAVVIQGLLSQGVEPSLWSWRVAGVTPYAALESYQLGCGDDADSRGAFFYPGDRSANVLATIQAVPALAGRTFPLKTSTVSRAVPSLPCASASTSARATVKATVAKAATAKALAGTAGACTGSTGVTVAVDFTAFTGGKVQVRCAPGTPATGVAALQQAGFTPAGTAKYGLAFVCRINSLPSTAQQACVTTPPATAYWGYYKAAKGATTWTYSSAGASTSKPAQGSIEAWAFGNSAKPSKTPAQVRATHS